jgi:DNA repair protein RadC
MASALRRGKHQGVPENRGITTWPEAERPRERLRTLGPEAVSSRELLGILVGSGSRERSALAVAGELLSGVGGSLRRLSTLMPAELERVVGVGPAVAGRLAAALELGRRMAREEPAERRRIRGPLDVYEQCAPVMRDLAHEEFRVLLLNTQHAVLREILVTRGVLDASVVHAREVFRPAIAESASAIILVHNHPSGDPTPSAEDRHVTTQLRAAGELIGIGVLDHVIIGDGRWYSFAGSEA